jgi:spermidine synthase
VHGVTIHGYQFLSGQKRDIPTAYFGENSGGGLVLLNHPRRGMGMRVGVLGLGIGTLAAYGQPGDVYRFYEINPLVVDLADGMGGYFSYLSDCQAQVEIVLGDARLSLENELASGRSQNYDVLALDVFSSDSIPVHLLDAESFYLYLQHLRPDGILAVHISNRHLDLVPVVWTLADHYSLARLVIDDAGQGLDTFPSQWMLLTRDPFMLKTPDLLSHASPMDGYISPVQLWTDDYSNLFQILK